MTDKKIPIISNWVKISSIDFCIEHVDQVNRICAAKVDHIRAEGAKVNRVRSTILLLENHKDIETSPQAKRHELSLQVTF